jgi:hypothetical protein
MCVSTAGRGTPSSFKICMDLFGSFCTKKEVNSTLNQKTQMNLAGKDYKDAVRKVQKELEGSILQDKISSARMAFIFIQIMNNIREIQDPEHPEDQTKNRYEFRPKPEFLRFTSTRERNQTGGWNKDGIALYMEMISRETRERKKMTQDFGGDLRTERCDYFHPIEESENNAEDDDSSGDDEDGAVQFEYKDEFPDDGDEGDDNKNSDNEGQDDSE